MSVTAPHCKQGILQQLTDTAFQPVYAVTDPPPPAVRGVRLPAMVMGVMKVLEGS